MSENESLKISKPPSDGVPVYKISLVRESTVIESPAVPLRRSSDVAEMLRPLFAGLDREQFAVLLLDSGRRPVGVNIVSVGSLTASIVHPRETFKAAILTNSAAVILAHNHPSGSVQPSPEDIELTKRLRDAGELLGIRVLDHVIIGDGHAIFSFVDEGRW
jgi:DNA repair protein RadC